MTDTLIGSEEFGFSVQKRPFDYADPHINELNAEITERLRELERVAAEHYGDRAGHERKRRAELDLENPATKQFMALCPSVGHWLSLVPTAAALDPCYDPDLTHYPSGVEVDTSVREWFRNMSDPVGIRSRAAVMCKILENSARSTESAARWLSLACGAAQPVLQTMRTLRSEGKLVPIATLADLDRTALNAARAYADTHQLADQVRPVRMNVLDRRGFQRLPRRVPGLRRPSGWLEAFDVVDAVGLLEYLRPDDWTYTYGGVTKTKRVLAGAVTFLRNAFACVKPGGVLIVGNMLTTHPQLGFTMDVIQWPHIQPRTVEDVLTVFNAAGISGHVDVHLPSDGVYAVFVAKKPG